MLYRPRIIQLSELTSTTYIAATIAILYCVGQKIHVTVFVSRILPLSDKDMFGKLNILEY